uniref:Integrase catalytic domain-containing protein n=1 Tax=Fagus sylvatica TaxID=28930 RepID=A0A2N9GSZ5_FAGSY
MAGETSGPGPSEQEIRMVALERKFDELLSFVQLIAKRNTDDENQRKEDDKDTSEAEPEGHSNTNATPPRPPTPPKPEGKDSQLDSKIDSLEEKIRLIQGLNSFGNTDFSSMSWFPNMTVPPKFKAPEFEKYNGRGDPMIHLQMYCRKMAPYADNEPLLIQTFQDTLTGNAAEWYSQLKKISHWKELADTFLAQYGFNSQIAPDRFDLQRMEKKSNETFREYAQRPDTSGREDRRCLEDKEDSRHDGSDGVSRTSRQEGSNKEEGRGCANDREKQWETEANPPNFHHATNTVQPRPTPTPAPTQVPAPAPAPQVPARPVGNQPNDNRWPRKELRQFTPLPMPLTELYPILIEKSLISPIVPRPYNGPQRRDFNPNSTCDFHFGEVGHTVENCGQLKHRVQDLIDHGVLKFEGLPNITTNPLPNHPEGGVNMVEIEEGNEERIAWRRLFYTLEKKRHITPLDAPPGPSTGDACEYHSGARGHSLECYDPSEFDWYAEINLDDIVEDEMDLDNLQDEEADWGYFMEDDTDEWRDVDFTEFFQFPCLIVPPGFVTPEFEIFYEDGDPEVHLQKYGEKMALHLENELLMISVFPESLSKQTAAWFYQLRNLTGWDDLVRVFLERYRFNPHSILEYLGLKKDEEPYIIPDPGVGEVIVEIKEEPSVLSLPALTEGEEEEEVKPLPPKPSIIHRQPREVKIGTRCAAEQKEALIALLREFHEIFAWSYQDMPGLDTDIVVHKIPLKPECKPVKQALRRMKPEVILKIKEEVEKQLKAGFLSTVTYSDWVANIVPVPKKDGKVRMCVDYRDLNRASPKDNFPLPHIDTLVDNTATNVVFSFMDGFSGYNQIKMAEEDKSKTAFITHWGTFVYDVMPFGLKNAGATYQRAMVTLFHDMIHHEIEHARAKDRERDPKLLGKNQLYSSLHCTAYWRTCEPLFKLLRKDVKIKWTEDCQRAFDKIKEYLLNPPILVPPTPGRPLILYLTVQEASMGCMLGQQDETGKKEQAIYYLSKKFTEPETRYLLVEKTCCALGLGLQEAETVHALLHHLVGIPNGPDQAIKGQAIADYLADYPSEQLELMDSEFPDEDHASSVLQAALEFGAYELEVFGDSLLIVSQTNGEWQARDPKLIPYQRYISRLVPKFKYVTFTYTPRAHNHFADALATLASLIKLVEGDDVRPLRIETRDIPAYCVCIEECMNVEAEIDNKPWYYDIKRFIQDRETTSSAGYGMPEMLITDNASNLNNRMMDQLCQQFKIQHHNSAPYRPKMNGAVEAANKNVKKILSKMTETYKDWHEHLPYALCAYRTSVRTSVGATPYSLVYGMEAVLPVEVEIPSLRILSQTQLEEAEWAQARYEQLNFIDEKRLAALCHGQLYQRRIERAYNKKARPRTFQPGDLVLKKRNMALSDPRGKFAPSYEGPYVVKKAFSGGAIILADMDGEEFRSPINSDSVIKYHV